jgi:nitroreductase
LAAYSAGLGTCWVGAFKEEDVKEILNTPKGIRPVALIPIGYASEAPAARRKRAITEVVHYEVFQAR